MGKRVWYNVTAIDETTGKRIKLATIKSKGLAFVTAQFYEGLYRDVRVE
jgi:hypothetical protein